MSNEKTIRWTAKPDLDKPDLGMEKVNCEIKELYTGTLTPELGAFSLHPHITFYNGMLIAHWSVHWGDEDSPGQYVRYAVSKDFGETWSDPYSDDAMIFPPMEKPLRNSDEKDADGYRIKGHRPHDRCGWGVKSENSWENDLCGHFHLMICSNGFAQSDGKLYAIAEPTKVVNSGIGRVARLVKDDGSLGDVMWLNEDWPDITQFTPDVMNAELYNNSAYDEKIASELISWLDDSRYMPQWDMHPIGWKQRDGKTAKDWGFEFAAVWGREHFCGEPTCSYEAADGTYVRLWRSNRGIQHPHFSYDKGVTWTEIGDSEFPDTGARTSVGNLPDGSAYLIGNPGFRRMQLCLSVSKDGYLFDKNFVIACEPETMKYRGRAKGTGFHYPHSVVAGDYLFVIYSQNKEDIHIAKIPLAELM